MVFQKWRHLDRKLVDDTRSMIQESKDLLRSNATYLRKLGLASVLRENRIPSQAERDPLDDPQNA